MTTLVLILWFLLAVLLLVVITIRPHRTKHSVFELQRKKAEATLERERLLGDIYAYRRMITILLVIILTVIGWVILQERGILIVLVVLPLLLFVSRQGPVKKYVMGMYNGQEAYLLTFAARWPRLGWLLGSDRRLSTDQKLESPEQLVHLVESAGHILTSDQQNIIKRGLNWHVTLVTDVMVPSEKIVSISHSELLGPLVLDDLHKSGHHMFPVIRGDVDHVIGMVNITELLRVDAIQKSLTAEKAMSPADVRINMNESLPQALEKLTAHPGQFGIIVDDHDKTLGLVTLEDVLKALLG